MKLSSPLLVIAVILAAVLARAAQAAKRSSPSSNYRPVIGVLAQPTSSKEHEQYIAGSYIKFIEQAGGRAVPLYYDQIYKGNTSILADLNGVLFCGGGVSLAKTSRYMQAQKTIFDFVVRQNANHDKYYPLWATCLGFEAVMEIVAERYDVLWPHFDAWNISMKLDVTPLAKESRLFSGQRGQLTLQDAISRPITMNNHHSGIRTEDFKSNPKLMDFFNILSTNKDRNGVDFISTVEAKDLPIYGVQYHPEKNNFEWTLAEGIDHSLPAVQLSQHMGNFFVQEARKNDNRFPMGHLTRHLIYNHCPRFTQPQGSDFTVEYFFPTRF